MVCGFNPEIRERSKSLAPQSSGDSGRPIDLLMRFRPSDLGFGSREA